jgi:hypothetical protein
LTQEPSKQKLLGLARKQQLKTRSLAGFFNEDMPMFRVILTDPVE